MRFNLKSVIFLIASLWVTTGFGQIKNFEHGWKIKLGDMPEWANYDYNDEKWDTIQIGKQWSDQGIKHDDIAWQRKNVFFPKNLKTKFSKYGASVSLGFIDDADETYFNGQLIGHTGNMEANDGESYYVPRNYHIPKELIRWGENNVIAVRIHNWIGGGGIYKGKCGIGSSPPDSLFSFYPKLISDDGNGIFQFEFGLPKADFVGTIMITVLSQADQSMQNQIEKKIKLSKGESKTITIKLAQDIAVPVSANYSICFDNYSHLLSGKLYPLSNVLRDFSWSSERYSYPDTMTADEKGEIDLATNIPARVNGDTYPCTWAENDIIYMSSGDPDFPWGKKGSGMDFEKIIGAPTSFKVKRVNQMFDFTGGGGSGKKPSGLIAVDDKLYLAVQNMLGFKPPRFGNRSQHGSDVSIFSSSDFGFSWQPDVNPGNQPMFPGNLFGGLAFINSGKNNEGARDSFIYAVSNDQWDNGSELRLGRVHKDSIMIPKAWEWVEKFDKAHIPMWTGNLEKSTPIFTHERSIGAPEMVYISQIKRYLFFTWKLKDDFNPITGTELFVYDSPEPWGPFSLVYHEQIWETLRFTPYCPRLPLKWVEVKDSALTGWILYSGSWSPHHDFYHPNVRKFKLKLQ